MDQNILKIGVNYWHVVHILNNLLMYKIDSNILLGKDTKHWFTQFWITATVIRNVLIRFVCLCFSIMQNLQEFSAVQRDDNRDMSAVVNVYLYNVAYHLSVNC